MTESEMDWPFAPVEAARLVATAAWPMERADNRDEWCAKLLTEPEMRERTVAKAQSNLSAAIAAIANSDTPCWCGHPDDRERVHRSAACEPWATTPTPDAGRR